MIQSIVRLHISPLDPSLLPTILGAEVSKVATNISFHALQTFPENSYGYVDLPAMEAEKVKKKMNGAILKGKKMKVEEARSKKRKRVNDQTDDAQTEVREADTLVASKKMSKNERNVVSGHELSPERKVKRGWTDDKSDASRRKKVKSKSATKQQSASKYSEKDELLFKTKIPKNKASGSDKEAKRNKRIRGNTEIVHEFENSTNMPSFLRAEVSGDGNAVAYEDEKGWVDQGGELVEREHSRASRRRKISKHGIESEVTNRQPTKVDISTIQTTAISKSVSGSSSNSDDLENKTNVREAAVQVQTMSDDSVETDSSSEETSSSGTSESDPSSEASSEAEDDLEHETTISNTEESLPRTGIHPLEALFKKPAKPASSQVAANSQDIAKPSLEIHTSFSFFDHSEDNDNLPPIPTTPFSSQDQNTRGVRSAAPTPDTAHPSRMGSIFNGEESDGELSEMGEDVNPNDSSHTLQLPQSEFEKQFWEKRGENNRAWKARRRAVLKEKRQKENRARRPRNW